MNILLVCNKYPFPPHDGGSLATFNMVRGLVDEGFKVDILAMYTSKHYNVNHRMKTGLYGLRKIKGVFINNSISYPKLTFNLLFSSLPYNAGRFINNEFGRLLAEMLKETKYEIVQLEGLYLSSYVRIIRNNSCAKIVYRAHNVEHSIWQKYCIRENNLLKRWYLGTLYGRIRRLEQKFINMYDILVTITENDLEALNSMGNVRPAIISPFGTYESEPVENTNDSIDKILYIGALDWMPNIEALTWFIDEVWPVVKKMHPGIRFFVAGRNAGKKYVRYLAGRGIDFKGEVESAGKFLSENGIVIVPLFSGSGMRVRIIEAMFAGRPVIASSIAATGIPVENEKDILLADDASGFVNCIDKLISEKGFATRLGESARQFSQKNYDNRKIAKKLAAFYQHFIL